MSSEWSGYRLWEKSVLARDKYADWDEAQIQQRLDTQSLRRLKHLFDSSRAIGFVTAARLPGECGPGQNRTNNLKLDHALREAGYGRVWVDGVWIDGETTERVPEASIFVVGGANDSGRLRTVLLKCAVEYNQGAFAYRFENQRLVKAIDQQGTVSATFEGTDWDRFIEEYARFREGARQGSRTFAVERVRIEHSGFGTRMQDSVSPPTARERLLRRLHDLDEGEIHPEEASSV